jgi:hypothetical protein
MSAPAPGREAILAFMRAYLEMPPDADVEVGFGHDVDTPDELLLTVKVSHPQWPHVAMIAMPPGDARGVADLCEATLRRHPESELENLILALRYGADVADKAATA